MKNKPETHSLRANSFRAVVLTGLLLIFCVTAESAADERNLKELHAWSGEEIKLLRSLSLSSLPPLPEDPSNAYADNLRAGELGKKIFFDKKFSANGKVSCATCHIPENGFTDKLPQRSGAGRGYWHGPFG